MEFRRINGLPPYVFAAINQLRDEARHAGEDVIDLGFGNPYIPSPPVAVEKLAEAARTRGTTGTRHRGVFPNLRLAVSNLYKRRFDVALDPESEVVFTDRGQGGPVPFDVGTARAVGHGAGAVAVVPDTFTPPFAGADVRQVRLGPGEDFFANLEAAWKRRRGQGSASSGLYPTSEVRAATGR